jgi:apolipoprotein D and lipocalin family protein
MMKAAVAGLLLALSLIYAAAPAHAQGSRGAVQVVPSVDLARYMGKWYEIAHLPAWFQRGCASDSTGNYTLRPDGKITVLNECRKANGGMRLARGIGRLASDKGPNTKLEICFFWPFYGDYWIIDLDPEYRWAVVGDPDREYMWILSRETKLDPALYAQIVGRARNQGYEVDSLIVTKHSH